MSRRSWLAVGTAVATLVAGAILISKSRSDVQAHTMHYAANGNFSATGDFQPGTLGYNLADVSSRAELDSLSVGVKGLAYLGTCTGVTPGFRATIDAYDGDALLFGYYLIDEPSPAKCPPKLLNTEVEYIHAHQPGRLVFTLIQNLSSSRHPSFAGGYTPANSAIDLYGIAPYPCRTELHGCDMAMISRYVTAAEAAGIPRSRMVPVFQAFGAGSWMDDGGGHYELPAPAQARALLKAWARLLPHPKIDVTYSFGTQRQDQCLDRAPTALQQVFAAHNR